MKKNKEWGICYPCPNCGITIKFPKTPNAGKDKYEALAHAIYSCMARNKGICWRCKSEYESNKKRNRKKKSY